MFKHQLVGRLGLVVSVLVLANACVGGEIGDAPGGGARLGPEASDPFQAADPGVGNEGSPLVCPGASPDVSAQNGWRSSEASVPADGALRFELKARPTAANLNGLVAVGDEGIDDFPKAAIAVRFADNGLVDVRDGAFYSSDLAYPYDPGVWYSIAISADIDAETYDVEIGPCGESRKTLINDASFRDNADISGQLSEWAVWSSQAAALEVSTPAWMNSEGCAPATCLSLGHTCGTPQDGCGGVLSCGVCGHGELCSSGTCIDAPANASPPPPPSCTPTTCQSLGRECGQWGDGCGGILSCGSCSGGETCSIGVCVPPAPPACTPASCQSLGAECGLRSDGCGGILSCGSCNGGAQCLAGVCVDVPPNAPPPPACTPATCQSLGNECGQWDDRCGGVLSCGSCSGGETCAIDICVPPAPPACTPNTCQSLGRECEQWGDGCGGILSCGSCSGGETCSSGVCVPPPPACTPASCQSLGAECGLRNDGCGGTLSCGSCSGGETCSSGTCIDASPPPPPPPSGTPYGHVVPSDVGNTIGVGVVGPVPTQAYTGPMSINTDGTVIENVVISGNTPLSVYANNVTIRNVIFDVNATYALRVVGDGPGAGRIDNILVEYSKVENRSSGKAVGATQVSNFVMQKNEIKGGQDWHFMDGDLIGLVFEDNYYHSVVGDAGAHSDGFQLGVFNPTPGTMLVRGNYFDPNNATIGKTDLLFCAGNPGDNDLEVTWENNYMHGYGYYTLRCGDCDWCKVRNNVYDNSFQTAEERLVWVRDHALANSAYECNRYADGGFVDESRVVNITHITTGCPSYP